jgi:micrococcal nuclease
MVSAFIQICWRRSRPRRWFTVAAIALLILSLWGRVMQAEDDRMTAVVDYAKSGQTLELLYELNLEPPVTSIRLEGVQAPDREQEPWGEAARECLAATRNQIIRLETDDWTADQYGRLWAYGWQGKTLLNRQVLEQGCAFLSGDRLAHGEYYQDLLYAQERARLLGLGIWNPKNPLRETPERFRQRSHSP